MNIKYHLLNFFKMNNKNLSIINTTIINNSEKLQLSIEEYNNNCLRVKHHFSNENHLYDSNIKKLLDIYNWKNAEIYILCKKDKHYDFFKQRHDSWKYDMLLINNSLNN